MLSNVLFVSFNVTAKKFWIAYNAFVINRRHYKTDCAELARLAAAFRNRTKRVVSEKPYARLQTYNLIGVHLPLNTDKKLRHKFNSRSLLYGKKQCS